MERYTPTALVVFAFMGVFYLEGFDMGKDPAFLFYPNDWLGGTMGMTFEEKGAYMELLMLQFNRGHMTSHMIGQVVGQLWDKVGYKFIQDDLGLYYNERLEEEQTKRKAYTESRHNNRDGKNQYTKKENKKGGHMTLHMENENENKDIVKDNLLKREDIFKKEILTYINTYPKEMLKDFFDYWSEANKSKTKMRFEMQPTWDIKKRLATWAKNDKGFKQPQKGTTQADMDQILINKRNKLLNAGN